MIAVQVRRRERFSRFLYSVCMHEAMWSDICQILVRNQTCCGIGMGCIAALVRKYSASWSLVLKYLHVDSRPTEIEDCDISFKIHDRCETLWLLREDVTSYLIKMQCLLIKHAGKFHFPTKKKKSKCLSNVCGHHILLKKNIGTFTVDFFSLK